MDRRILSGCAAVAILLSGVVAARQAGQAVVIKGRAIGTAENANLPIFGIEAQHLVSIKIAGLTVPLTAGAGNDLHASRRPLGATFDAGGDFDFNAFEVPIAP